MAGSRRPLCNHRSSHNGEKEREREFKEPFFTSGMILRAPCFHLNPMYSF